jgi:hypothetical protein
LGFGHKATQIPALDIATDEQPSAYRITADFDGSIGNLDIGNLRNRDLPTCGVFDFELGKFFDVSPPFRAQSDLHWKSPLAFENLTNDFSSNTSDGIEYIASMDAVTS